MKVLFRCDAGRQLGLGHLMRCLTLAQELRAKGAQCLFLCRAQEGFSTALLEQAGFACRVLSKPAGYQPVPGDVSHAAWLGVSQSQDVQDSLAELAGQTFDWLVVDHYALDARWEGAMRDVAQHILVIDDLADRRHDCDALLDQNLDRAAADHAGLIGDEVLCLAGVSYALLRPEFAQWRERSLAFRQGRGLQRIMLSLGGVDKDNLSGEILDKLAQIEAASHWQIELILGHGAPHEAALRAYIAETKLNISLACGVNNMAERLSQTDLVIGASGSSSWERCCLGVPTLMWVMAENQLPLAQALEKHGAALRLSDLSVAALGAALEQCAQRLPQMGASAADLLDGQGAQRVAGLMWQRQAA